MKARVFLKIGITPHLPHPREAEIVTKLLESGEYDYFHLRHPDSEKNTFTDLLERIPVSLHRKLKLHSHFDLLSRYSLGGCHLNSRTPEKPSVRSRLSKSCHSIKEIEALVREEKENINCYEYITLSPIFDSISKEGYKSAINIKDIELITDFFHPDIAVYLPPIIALGGVTPEKYGILKEKGFGGAAILGYIWNSK